MVNKMLRDDVFKRSLYADYITQEQFALIEWFRQFSRRAHRILDIKPNATSQLGNFLMPKATIFDQQDDPVAEKRWREISRLLRIYHHQNLLHGEVMNQALCMNFFNNKTGAFKKNTRFTLKHIKETLAILEQIYTLVVDHRTKKNLRVIIEYIPNPNDFSNFPL